MMSTDFSVLFLAWDDADPGVAVLGGAALPPTLPLVYQLATQHPVLAVYPHLPAPEATTALEPAAAETASLAAGPLAPPAAADATAPASPLDAVADAPGVHLLATAEPVAPQSSRIVGLEDLLPAIQRALPTAHSLAPAPEFAPKAMASAARVSAPNRNQWPAGAAPHRKAWQAPAAPYAGAAAAEPRGSSPAPTQGKVREKFPPPPPAPPRPDAPPALAEAAGTPTAAAPVAEDGAAVTPPVTLSGSASIAAATVNEAGTAPALFDEPVAEIGSAEASDLAAPEDDLVPESLPAAETEAPTETKANVPPLEPATAWAVRQPPLNGLNFRMIQYARRAAQLTDGRQDFDVIYAPGWPAWLAALEIRNRSARPLVLYAAALASDAAPTAERGWLLNVERMALRRAHLVLVPDAAVLAQLRARHGEALGELRIVPATDEATLQLVLAEVALG